MELTESTLVHKLYISTGISWGYHPWSAW